MVQFEDARGLEDQDLDYSCDTNEIIVFFVVVNQFEENFSKKETILIGFGLPNEETLVAKISFSANSHQKFNYVPQSTVIIGF